MHTDGPWHVEDTNSAKQSKVVVAASLVANGNTVVIGLCAGPDMEDNSMAISATPSFMEAAAMMTAAEQSGGDMWWAGFEKLKAAFKKAGGQFPSIDQVKS